MSEERIAAAADELDAARRSGRRIAAIAAGNAPATPATAYRIQYETARRRGGIGGWKISPGREDGAAIPADVVLPSPALFASPLPIVVEVEIAFRIGRDLPPREVPYELDSVCDAVASIHPALEIQGSRYFEPKAVDPLLLLADGQSCLALVWGEGIANWRDVAFDKVNIGLAIDGVTVADRPRGAPTEDVLATLVWLANHAASSCGGLTAGTMVITGARAGPVSVIPDCGVRGEVSGIGTVSVTLHR